MIGRAGSTWRSSGWGLFFVNTFSNNNSKIKDSNKYDIIKKNTSLVDLNLEEYINCEHVAYEYL